MILVTRRNHMPLFVNPDRIETIEATPDTILTLVGGDKLVLEESADEVVTRILEHRRRLNRGPFPAVVTPLFPRTQPDGHGEAP